MNKNIKAIALVDDNFGLGADGKQNIFIKSDLENFKNLTNGHSIILGRKTLSTFPHGKPLPNRRNLVLSTDPNFTVEGAEVFHSVEAVLKAVAEEEEVFVVGGESIYKALLPYCNEVFLTQVQHSYPADCYFPSLDDDWELHHESKTHKTEEEISYRFCTYGRKEQD